MPFDAELLSRFHRVLVAEIRRSRPTNLERPFTVAEIYRDLVPYRTHRNVLGVAMNGDYEDALLRLLGGEGDFLILDSDPARREIRKELESSNPNTALYREFATVDVRLNPAALDEEVATVTLQDDTNGQGGGAMGQEPTTEPGEETVDDTSEVVPVSQLAPDATNEGEALADQSETPVHDDGPARVWGMDSATSKVETPTPPPQAAAAAAPAEGLERCRWCAQDLPEREGLNYCPHCGGDARLSPCSAYGEALEPSWRYCVACGTEVSHA